MKKSRYLLFTAALCLALLNIPVFASETDVPYVYGNLPIGANGFVTGMVFHPLEEGLIYIRTDVGGAYRWDKDSEIWTPLCDFIDASESNLFGIDGIAVDPGNADTVYMAAGKYTYRTGDVLKSTDRGATWTKTGLNQSFNANGGQRGRGECIAVNPADSSVIYCGVYQNGLWRSSDGAETWQKVTGLATSNNIRNIVFAGTDIYAGVMNEGLYKSSDGGENWALLSGSPEKISRISVAGEKLYIASDTGLFVYNNNLFTRLSPSGWGSVINAVDAVEGANGLDTIVCIGYNSNASRLPIYYSTDGGAAWTKATTNHISMLPWTEANNDFCRNGHDIKFNPFNINQVWFADWHGVWRTDGIFNDSVWNEPIEGIEEVVPLDAACLPLPRENYVSYAPPYGANGTALPNGWAGDISYMKCVNGFALGYGSGNGAIWGKNTLVYYDKTVFTDNIIYNIRVNHSGTNGNMYLYFNYTGVSGYYAVRLGKGTDFGTELTKTENGETATIASDTGANYVSPNGYWRITYDGGSVSVSYSANGTGGYSTVLEYTDAFPLQNGKIGFGWDAAAGGGWFCPSVNGKAYNPVPPYRLLTAIADVEGMAHETIDEYPKRQLTKKPRSIPWVQSTASIDFCEQDPNILLRVGIDYNQKGRVEASADCAENWIISGSGSGVPLDEGGNIAQFGRAAVSAEKNAETGYPSFVIIPVNGLPLYSKDFGATWTEGAGISDNTIINDFGSKLSPLASDRVIPDKFYICSKNKVYVSVDGGENWTQTVSLQGNGNAITLKTAPDIPNEVWVGFGETADGANNGALYRSSDGGQSFVKMPDIKGVRGFGFGKAAPGGEVPAAYLYGIIGSDEGLWRSLDMGATWQRINDGSAKMGDAPRVVEGDRRNFGVVYVGTDGRGMFVGQPKSISFYKDGAPLSGLSDTAGKEILCAAAYNTSDFNGKTGSYIVCLYNGHNRLEEVLSINEAEIGGAGTLNIFGINIPAYVDASYRLGVYCWDGIGTMTPLSATVGEL
jgi:photosystem II stability/assembly factor-like uncharacterized protein